MTTYSPTTNSPTTNLPKNYMWAITDIIGIGEETEKIPLIGQSTATNKWVYIPRNRGTTPYDINNIPEDMNDDIFGPYFYLAVNYTYVDINNSDIPILTYFAAKKVEFIDASNYSSACASANEVIKTYGSAFPPGIISGHEGTTDGCKMFQGCIKYRPANNCTSFIVSIMISVQPYMINNKPDLTKSINIDKRNYLLNVCKNNTKIHEGCPTLQSYFIVYANHTVYR